MFERVQRVEALKAGCRYLVAVGKTNLSWAVYNTNNEDDLWRLEAALETQGRVYELPQRALDLCDHEARDAALAIEGDEELSSEAAYAVGASAPPSAAELFQQLLDFLNTWSRRHPRLASELLFRLVPASEAEVAVRPSHAGGASAREGVAEFAPLGAGSALVSLASVLTAFGWERGVCDGRVLAHCGTDDAPFPWFELS